jgi:hypothetical protein
MTGTEKIKEAARLLREAFPMSCEVQLSVKESGKMDVSIHRVGQYAAATEALRQIGVGKRGKQVFDEGAWHSLKGNADGIEFTAFGDGLPPTCHKETYKEKIPKQQTVDTGEFVEVERTRIVCDGGEAA